MEIRPYAESDAPATLSVFLAAVTETASVHFSAEQIEMTNYRMMLPLRN